MWALNSVRVEPGGVWMTSRRSRRPAESIARARPRARVGLRAIALTAAASLVPLAPLTVTAQPAGGKVYRIGVLSPGSAQGSAADMAAFRTGLRELGYEEGRNIRIDWQFAEG